MSTATKCPWYEDGEHCFAPSVEVDDETPRFGKRCACGTFVDKVAPKNQSYDPEHSVSRTRESRI